MSSAAELRDVIAATVRDVLPIVVVLTGFQVFVLRRPLPNPRRLLLGCAFVFVGLVLFLVGLEQAILPVGRTMAAQLTAPGLLSRGGADPLAAPGAGRYLWVYAFAVSIGFSTTIAEPALIAVAHKARELSAGGIDAWGLRIAVAVGVGIGVGLGAYRIVVGFPLHHLIMVGYAVVVVQTLFAPRRIVPLAYDSGGVTTSTVTVPLVAGLGLGLAEAVPGRSPLTDGFGLIALASLFPMMTVMGYAQLSEWRNARMRARDRGEGADPAAPEED